MWEVLAARCPEASAAGRGLVTSVWAVQRIKAWLRRIWVCCYWIGILGRPIVRFGIITRLREPVDNQWRLNGAGLAQYFPSLLRCSCSRLAVAVWLPPNSWSHTLRLHGVGVFRPND